MTAQLAAPPRHRRLLRTVTRREVRAAARLLAAQSARGNRDADVLTVSLHRAGYDMRPDGDPFLRWEHALLAIAALMLAAAMALGALWIGPR